MNLWKEFVDGDPKIAAKLNGLPKIDPMVTMVDSALQKWMSQNHEVQFEFTPERREMLIRIVKKAIDYDFIEDSPFYQYVKAYISHLYYWLVELQRQDVIAGEDDEVDYWEIFDEVVVQSFLLGYAMGKIKPKKKKGGK